MKGEPEKIFFSKQSKGEVLRQNTFFMGLSNLSTLQKIVKKI